MLKRSYGLWVAFLCLLILVGCGKRINKQTLGPDEYFEYAKKKYDKGDYLDAITEFTVITLKFSANPVVDDAQYYLAESHYHQDEYLIAISEYQKLINDYPQSPYAVLAQFKIGLSFQQLSLRPELDQEYTKRALRAFNGFIAENPTHELAEKATQLIQNLRVKLARKKLIAATTYRKMGIWDSAVIYYDLILEEFYDTPSAAEALFWKGEGLLKLKKFVEAQNAFTAYVEKYPQHKHHQKAKERIEEIYEQLRTTQNDNSQ